MQFFQYQLDVIKWYHEFVLPNGLITRSSYSDINFHRALWQFIEDQLDKICFNNKSVLDIGCWDGKWSFYAEQAGASEVHATDDIEQSWSDGRGIHIIKQILDSKIQISQNLNVYDLDQLKKTFDIILFMGVYYHLYDPFYALAQIRHCCNSESIIVIEGSVGCRYPAGEVRYCLDDPNQSLFLPDEELWNKLIRAAYFEVIYEAYFSIEQLQANKDLITEPYADRKLLVCKPFVGKNELHYYPAPFGLHNYEI